MALLQCEICGGKLMAKSGGIFECEYCGMQYDKARIQEMVQEIKGTVKVEGTVEVTGSVKIDGSVKVDSGATAENFLKLGRLALESLDWKAAKLNYKKALDINAECAEAYFGLAMCEERVTDLDTLVRINQWTNQNYTLGKRFADQNLRKEMESREQAFLAELNAEVTDQQKQKLKELRERSKLISGMFASGEHHTVARRVDGSAVAFGINMEDCCEVEGWRNIMAVSANERYSIGLKGDGTVVTAGRIFGEYGCENISVIHAAERNIVTVSADGQVTGRHRGDPLKGWENVVAIESCNGHMIGLKKDGTVVAAGDGQYGQCRVNDWRDIVAIRVGTVHTAGLTAAGNVVAVGRNDKHQCDVNDWAEIVDISTGSYHTVGLRADGRVVAAGQNDSCQCDVSDWRNIVAISTGDYYTAGLTADGRVVATAGWGDDTRIWKNIVAIHVGGAGIVGVRVDGQLITTREPYEIRGKMRLFQNLDTLERDLASACEKAEKARYLANEKRKEAERIAQEKKKEAERIARIQQEQAECAAAKAREEKIRQLEPIRQRLQKVSGLISSYGFHIVAVKSDGRVVTYGYTDNQQEATNASAMQMWWKNIVAVSAVRDYAVALTEEGNVIATKSSGYQMKNSTLNEVTGWRNIVAVSSSPEHIVGLTDDGRVRAAGSNKHGQCEVSSWQNIVAVSAGEKHTVGLKSDGTVVAVGETIFGKCNVSQWRDIVAVSAGRQHTVGLQSDGKVLAVGGHEGCAVSDWQNIVAVDAGDGGTVGLCADGTVRTAGWVPYQVGKWRNVVAISTEHGNSVALTADGRVLSTYGENVVNQWKLFESLDTLDHERDVIRWKKAHLCRHCGGAFKGLFNKVCTSCGKPKGY